MSECSLERRHVATRFTVEALQIVLHVDWCPGKIVVVDS